MAETICPANLAKCKKCREDPPYIFCKVQKVQGGLALLALQILRNAGPIRSAQLANAKMRRADGLNDFAKLRKVHRRSALRVLQSVDGQGRTSARFLQTAESLGQIRSALLQKW